MSPSLSRRRFLTGSAALLAAGYLPLAHGKSTRAKLPIPRLEDGSNGEPIDLNIRQGQWSFHPGVKTKTLGFGQEYLGPTIRTRRNSELNLHYTNSLSEKVAIHGHGLHVPGVVDGGPQLAMGPGELWQPRLSIEQPAATCWYHSHTHGRTGHQVYHGLAGMMIIDDDESDALPLPRRYGVDDLPIIIQDRTFDSKGQMVYSLADADEDGWYGDTVVINGAIEPVASVPAGKVRLRVLNGANARFYIVAFADKRTFHKIGSDGGLLSSPVPLTAMEMAPGERCEIVVDLSDGNPAELLTLFEDEFDEEEEGIISSLLDLLGRSEKPLPPPSLTLVPDSSIPAHTEPLPDSMATITRPKPGEIVTTREFFLAMDGGGEQSGHGDHGAMEMTINGAVMDMGVINERVQRGVWERWRVRSDQGAHPFPCSWMLVLGGTNGRRPLRQRISRAGRTWWYWTMMTGQNSSSGSITPPPRPFRICITAIFWNTKIRA